MIDKKSKIYITGDMHGEIGISKFNSDNFPEGKTLTKDDYVIVLGDFGLVWNYKETGCSVPSNPNDKCWTREEYYWLKWLNNKPWTTLFIDGNHENFNRLKTYPITEWNGGKVQKISDSVIHLLRGEVYTINDTKIFTFGGAKSIDRGTVTGTEEKDINKIWWKEELPSQEELDNAISNLEKHHFNVDYILTHALPNNLHMRLGYSDFDTLTSFLWNVHDMTKFKGWYCGHYHRDEQISYATTVLFNKIIPLGDIVEG